MEETMKKKYKTGAGILIFKKTKGNIEILALEGPISHQRKHNGKWDFPKGVIDPGESVFDCAIRETYEEANYMVSKNDIIAGPFKVSECWMYIASYDNIQIPKVKRNPVTGIREHRCYSWIPIDSLTTTAYDWLRPFVFWAKKVINGA